jgi:glycosyltransferase involved in cell wall biosynthesis
MKVLFIARSTLYSVYGGDTVQIISTAKYLRKLDVEVDIKLSHEPINYAEYDLMHVFNAIRPADALVHIKKARIPYVLSTIFVDFSEYQRKHATGIARLMGKTLNGNQQEYIKAIARWAKNGEKVKSRDYLLKGHKRAVEQLANGAALLLPNSENEYKRFIDAYRVKKDYRVIWNGLDPEIFWIDDNEALNWRDPKKVLCVARIEGKKNQLNLIKALNNTPFQLKLIGKPAPNHIQYYENCRAIASGNISFEAFMPQEELVEHYLNAKVHVLASWNETCGLSSLEAAYAGCNLVITNKGDTKDYFGNEAWYCDPEDPASIYDAVLKASEAPYKNTLRERIISTYNWEQAARQTLQAYEKVLDKTDKPSKNLYRKNMVEHVR